jgi:Kef-type K+ transport system membrane component KefB
MTILYILLILLIVTRAFGEAAQRLGQPALTGELLSGVVLGLAAGRFSEHLPILAGLADNEVFHAIRDLGIFFLMLLAGVELKPRELARASASAAAVAVAGMLLPLVLGYALGMVYLPASDYRFGQALFIGVALSVTAVPVAIKVMRDVGRMDTTAGRIIVSAAVIDDVLSLLLLAFLTGVLRAGTLPDAAGLLLLGAKVALFFAVTIALGRYLFPWLTRVLKRACQEEFELSGVLIAGLAYALLAEALSMHFIIGASWRDSSLGGARQTRRPTGMYVPRSPA